MKLFTMAEIDLRKIMPFLIGLFSVAIIGTQGLFFIAIGKVKESLEKSAMDNQIVLEEYVKTIEKVSLSNIMNTFNFPLVFMAIIGLLLILFGFYLWYKEWFGASKQIYTLLTLKGSRMRIFTAKLLVFLFIFLAYYGITLLNLYLAGEMAGLLLPEGVLKEDLLHVFLMQDQISAYLLPIGFESLAYHIAFLIMMFSILSVAVLSDRSKRIWGLIFGIIYIIVSMYAFIYLFTLDLYTAERQYANWLFVAVYLMISLLLNQYLLKKKVSI